MSISAPNPEVYRHAARILINGHEKYSCYAIGGAMDALKIPYGKERDMYYAQYQAMFGTFINGEIVSDSFSIRFFGKNEVRKDDHPFWNSENKKYARQNRIMALLMMAEICENPNT
jgi:hypothetical protein